LGISETILFFGIFPNFLRRLAAALSASGYPYPGYQLGGYILEKENSDVLPSLNPRNPDTSERFKPPSETLLFPFISFPGSLLDAACWAQCAQILDLENRACFVTTRWYLCQYLVPDSRKEIRLSFLV
jgi:hypothetical protein